MVYITWFEANWKLRSGHSKDSPPEENRDDTENHSDPLLEIFSILWDNGSLIEYKILTTQTSPNEKAE